MARKVIWSYEAAADLESLAEYIARDSSFYAASFVRDIVDAGRSLTRFAERGRVVPELSNNKIRELFIKDYRLTYDIEKSRVVIPGLIHAKRDLARLWESGKKTK
jgi:toxin ParE1/3/4